MFATNSSSSSLSNTGSTTVASVLETKSDHSTSYVSNNETDSAFDDILSQLTALGTEIDQELCNKSHLSPTSTPTVRNDHNNTLKANQTKRNDISSSDTTNSSTTVQSYSYHHLQSDSMMKVDTLAQSSAPSPSTVLTSSSPPPLSSGSNGDSHHYYPPQSSSPFHHHQQHLHYHHHYNGQSLDRGSNDSGIQEISSQLRTDSPDNDSAFCDTISLISSEQSSSSSSSTTVAANGSTGGSGNDTSIGTQSMAPNNSASHHQPHHRNIPSSQPPTSSTPSNCLTEPLENGSPKHVMSNNNNNNSSSTGQQQQQQQLFFESLSQSNVCNGKSNENSASKDDSMNPEENSVMSIMNDDDQHQNYGVVCDELCDRQTYSVYVNTINQTLNNIDWNFLSLEQHGVLVGGGGGHDDDCNGVGSGSSSGGVGDMKHLETSTITTKSIPGLICSSSLSTPLSPETTATNESTAFHCSNDIISTNSSPPPPPDTDIEEKIRVALEKIREANIRKLYLKVFAQDNSAKSLLANERMSIGAICRQLAQKNHIPTQMDHCIIEHIPQLYLERFYEDHESMVENVLYWGRDSGNKLFFMPRADKYDLFVHPERYLMLGRSLNDSATTDSGNTLRDNKYSASQLRGDLVEQFFTGATVRVPEIEGNLYLRSEGKKVWKKFFFTLRSSGLYYCAKGKPKSTKDLICLTTFELNCVYYGFGWKKKFKAPNEFGFAIKHPQIQVKSPKHIKYLCAESEEDLRLWMTGIRIAKYGRQLFDNFEQFKLAEMSSANGTEVVAEIESKQHFHASNSPDCSALSNGNGNYQMYSYGEDGHYAHGHLHQSNNSVIMRQNRIDRNDSVRSSSASSSSGCMSEQSSVVSTPSSGSANGGTLTPDQATYLHHQQQQHYLSSPYHSPYNSNGSHHFQQPSPLNAFDADFPVGTIKRKPSVMLQPKIPLTNTTRNLALQSDDALLEVSDGSGGSCTGEEECCLNSIGSPHHNATAFERGTFKSGTLRRSTTDERLKSSNKIYDVTGSRMPMSSQSPMHHPPHNSPMYHPLVSPQGNKSFSASSSDPCHSDDDLPPPPPPDSLKEAESIQSLNSFPPPPPPELLSTSPNNVSMPNFKSDQNHHHHQRQQSQPNFQVPLSSMVNSHVPMTPQPQPKNNHRLARRLSDLSTNSTLFLNFRNNSFDQYHPATMAPNSRASIATASDTLPNGFATMKSNSTLLNKNGYGRFQRQLTLDHLNTYNKYGTSPRVRYESSNGADQMGSRQTVNHDGQQGNYDDLANLYNRQHSLNTINGHNGVHVNGTNNKECNDSNNLIYGSYGAHTMDSANINATTSNKMASHCSLLTDNKSTVTNGFGSPRNARKSHPLNGGGQLPPPPPLSHYDSFAPNPTSYPNGVGAAYNQNLTYQPNIQASSDRSGYECFGLPPNTAANVSTSNSSSSSQPKENHYMSISPHLLQKHQQMQRQQQLQKQMQNGTTSEAAYGVQHTGGVSIYTSGRQASYTVPEDVFLKNMERVMQKKWHVAQMLNQDQTATPGQVLGFRDSAYLPPPPPTQQMSGNQFQMGGQSNMAPASFNQDSNFGIVLVNHHGQQHFNTQLPPQQHHHHQSVKYASHYGSPNYASQQSMIYGGSNVGTMSPTSPSQCSDNVYRPTSAYHNGVSKVVRISDANPTIISPPPAPQQSMSQYASELSLASSNSSSNGGGGGQRKVPPPPPKRSENTQLTATPVSSRRN